MTIEWVFQTPKPDINCQWLENQLLSVLPKLRNQTDISPSLLNLELTVVFVSMEMGAQLNKQFRGRDSATDVLSFEGDRHHSLGEVVLTGSVVANQAEQHQLSFADETLYLVLHGILHLLGFEHENGGPQAERMMTLQDELFAELCERAGSCAKR